MVEVSHVQGLTKESKQVRDQDEDVHRFSCDQVDRIGPLCFGLLGLFACLFIPIFAFIHDKDHSTDAIRALSVMVCGSLFLALVLLNAFIRTADIVVDERGIRRRIFGKLRYDTSWSDLKRIRVKRATRYADLKNPPDQYFLDTSLQFRLPNTKGATFMFTSQFQNVRELLDIINVRATKHNIEIVDCRQQPPVRLTKL